MKAERRLKFQGDPHLLPASGDGHFLQRNGRAVQRFLAERSGDVRRHHERGNIELAAAFQTSLEQLPGFPSRFALTVEKPALETCGGRYDAVVGQQGFYCLGRLLREELFKFRQPDLDRRAFAGGIVLDVPIKRSVQRANLADGWNHGSRHSGGNFADAVVSFDSPLFQRIAITNCHRVIGQRLAIDRNAIRRAGFILSAIARADCLLFVVEYRIIRLFEGPIDRPWRLRAFRLF